ncbi:MAG: hypothetical protein HYV36_01480 [Lentisphaerae bacterium]|nr:hypothetical protein [Lentisphaerota bacterium]
MKRAAKWKHRNFTPEADPWPSSLAELGQAGRPPAEDNVVAGVADPGPASARPATACPEQGRRVFSCRGPNLIARIGRLCGVVAVCWASATLAEQPVYPVKQEQRDAAPFLEQLKRKIKPLRHARGKRWPMILWECGAFEPQKADVYTALLERGLTQHIRLDDKMIPTAKALQASGAPVIMMEGAGGPWPANLAGDPKKWAHQFEAGYTFKPEYAGETVKPCLGLQEGWALNAERVRGILAKFREAGVTVDALWLDWESDPLGNQYEQASHCARCRQMLPQWALASKDNCRQYCTRLYLQLLDAYLAAPAKEVFPKCSIVNWMVVGSMPERPVLFWNNRPVPPGVPALFLDTNPVAYGNTVYWEFWNPAWPLDREHVDQFYTHLLLRMVSANQFNLRAYAPEKDAIPWVARWCPDVQDDKIPIISRERYRECLRHLWLRGVDAMQIFNPARAGYEDIVFAEVEDAVAIYDEMLAFAKFLDDGETLCLDEPAPQDDGVLWSGLRLKDEAVIRLIKQGGGSAKISIAAWPGTSVELKAMDEGATWLLTRDGQKVAARKAPGY